MFNSLLLSFSLFKHLTTTLHFLMAQRQREKLESKRGNISWCCWAPVTYSNIMQRTSLSKGHMESHEMAVQMWSSFWGGKKKNARCKVTLATLLEYLRAAKATYMDEQCTNRPQHHTAGHYRPEQRPYRTTDLSGVSMNKCIYMLPSTASSTHTESKMMNGKPWSCEWFCGSWMWCHKEENKYNKGKKKEQFLQHFHTHTHTEQSSSGEISIVTAAVRSLISHTRVTAENNNRSIFRNPRLSTQISNQAQWFNSMKTLKKKRAQTK